MATHYTIHHFGRTVYQSIVLQLTASHDDSSNGASLSVRAWPGQRFLCKEMGNFPCFVRIMVLHLIALISNKERIAGNMLEDQTHNEGFCNSLIILYPFFDHMFESLIAWVWPILWVNWLEPLCQAILYCNDFWQSQTLCYVLGQLFLIYTVLSCISGGFFRWYGRKEQKVWG